MTEDCKNKIKFLVKFLKEKNAYDKYRHNLFLERGYYYGTFLKMYMNSGILSNSFFCSGTKEGFNYWKELHDEFKSKYFDKFVQKW